MDVGCRVRPRLPYLLCLAIDELLSQLAMILRAIHCGIIQMELPYRPAIVALFISFGSASVDMRH